MIERKSTIISTSSLSDFNRKVADLFIKSIQEVLNRKDSVYLALSGGSTPTLIFELIVNEFIDYLDWSKVYIFWVDERNVSHSHEESNFGVAKKMFLDKLPDIKYFPIAGDMLPDKSAAEYEKLLIDNLPIEKGLPVFDLIMFGMGTDGHIASLFPNTDVLTEKDRLVAHVWVPEKKAYRITLTFPILNRARRKIFAFFGEDKLTFFDRIKSSSDSVHPIQMLDYSKSENYFIIGKTI